jgi:catechol 2,3-dioxygenase-like lactoylglutathione lyase family enzyme
MVVVSALKSWQAMTAFARSAWRTPFTVQRNGTEGPVRLPGGVIPPHATQGAGHFALAVASDDLEDWPARLREHGILIESEVHWERGGASLYFRDPDNNLVELATPGVWANY